MVDDSAMRAKTSDSDVSTSRKKRKLKLDKVIARCLIWSADFPDKESNQEDGTIRDIRKAKGVLEGDRLSVVLGLGAVGISGWRNGSRVDSMERNQQKVAGSQGRKWGRPWKLGVTDNQQKVAGSHGRKRGRPWKLGVTDNQQKVAGSEGRKRGRPRKSRVKLTDPKTEAGKCTFLFPPNELVRKNADDVTGIEGLGNEAADMAVILSEGVAEDDQPLSMWFGGLSCSLTSNRLRDWKQRRQVGTPTTNSSPPAVSTSSDDTLPFVKRSPVWATLESEEIFQSMPQKPHFGPLMECKEDYREGIAIGIMATFSNLCKKISSLGIDDSRTSFETTLDSLSEMGKHGFDVTSPRGRINKLLSIREPVSECLNVVKNAETELQHHVEEKRKLDATIQGIQKEISVLQQTLVTTKTQVDANEAKTAVAQSRVDEIKVRIENARNEFERLAASPWN